MAKGVRNVIEVFKAMPAVKRISFLIILVIVAVGFVAFFTNPNRPNYTVLFTDLDSVEAVKITEKLKEKKVKYLLKDSGSTILVAHNMVNNLRLDMATEGILPKVGSVGFEILDDLSFGTTEFERKLRYQKAFQGVLEKTIEVFPDIDEAKVHIISAVESTPTREGKPASVAVTVKRHPGRELNATQLQKIVNLVSGSVKGLKPENISIVDVENGILIKGNDLTIPSKK